MKVSEIPNVLACQVKKKICHEFLRKRLSQDPASQLRAKVEKIQRFLFDSLLNETQGVGESHQMLDIFFGFKIFVSD